MKKPLYNADDAEEYFSSLCVFYRETANEIFKRDNDGRHASKQIFSSEYQKYLGMQIAMREVLEYFSKFELIQPQKTNADRIRAMSVEELARLFVSAVSDGCPPEHDWDCKKDEDGWDACDCCWAMWLRQPVKEDTNGMQELS